MNHPSIIVFGYRAKTASPDRKRAKMGSSEFDSDPITLSRFILAYEVSFSSLSAREKLCVTAAQPPDATGEFSRLMSSIQLACKVIATAVRKAGISGLYGLEGTVNVQGEEVKKLDIISHNNFVNAIISSKSACVLVSEEQEEPILVEERLAGNYCVCFDPLDGSSNIDCNVSVGSIFGIYRNSHDKPGSVSDVLQPGTNLRGRLNL